LEDNLTPILTHQFKNDKEIIIFGEYIGDNSFAGMHVNEPKKIILFDIMVCNVQRKFLRPQDFIKLMGDKFEIPKVVYRGNLNEEFIQDVRNNKFGLNEGVICKGTEPTGNAAGGIWQCKIKTNDYFDRLKEKFDQNWTKYAE
jgi:hypothetical protein